MRGVVVVDAWTNYFRREERRSKRNGQAKPRASRGPNPLVCGETDPIERTMHHI